jgi:hypothetical protein
LLHVGIWLIQTGPGCLGELLINEENRARARC